MSSPAARRRTLHALGMLLAPAIMLTCDLDLAAAGDPAIFRWSLALQVSMTLFLLAILGMVAELRPVADRAGLTGGLLAGFGATVGAVMQGHFRTMQTAIETVGGAEGEAIREALHAPAYILTTRAPGLAFPIGLVVLAVALVATRRAPALLGLLVAAGAVLFPIGRIGGLTWAIVASDVVLLVGLGWLGVRTLGGAAAEERPAAAEGLAA